MHDENSELWIMKINEDEQSQICAWPRNHWKLKCAADSGFYLRWTGPIPKTKSFLYRGWWMIDMGWWVQTTETVTMPIHLCISPEAKSDPYCW